MRSPAEALVFSLLCLAPGLVRAQVAPAAPAGPAPTSTPAVASSSLQPSLAGLQRTLGTLDVEKWKLPRPARDEARRNVDSIRQDMSATLPPLMTAADAAPGSVPAEFAMLRNVDALYDVALRLSATAMVAAPATQATALDQALGDLAQARRSLADRTAADATAQEHSAAELQGKLRASAAPVCPTSPPPPTEPKSRAKRAKPRPKPTPAPPTSPQ